MHQMLKRISSAGLLMIFISLLSFTLSSCKDEDDDMDRARVYIGSNAFNPSVINIPAGGTVIWENDDNVTHTVTSDSTHFDSGDLEPDETFSHTFNEVGTYPYHCEHHSGMTGMVIVQ